MFTVFSIRLSGLIHSVVILTYKIIRTYLGLDPGTLKYDSKYAENLIDRGENHVISSHIKEFKFTDNIATAKVQASMKKELRSVEVSDIVV